jgi:hypothetical protein
MRNFGIILVIAGIVALVLPYITFTKQQKVLDIGPIQAVKQEQQSIPLSPIVGTVILVAGAGIVIASVVKRPA